MPSEASVGRGAGVGAAGALGASAGLTASIACGFAFVICAPVFMFAGGTAGVGAAAVLESAAQDRDSPAESVQGLKRRFVDLDRRLAAFAQANEMDEQFRRVLVDRASAHWRVVPASTKNTLTVRLASFTLRAESEQRLALEVSVAVRMDSEDALSATPSRGPVVLQGEFRHQSSVADLGQWMDESGDFLRMEVARAYDSIAQQIVTTLAGRTAG